MPIEANLRAIQEKIARSCDSAGRDPSSVTLIAVSKTVPVDLIREAYDCGVRDFGESRWQEAQGKLDQLPGDVTWHFIGKLQSNKAKRVAVRFPVVHTVESEGQVAEMEKAGRSCQALIELNLAREPQKGGIFVENLDSLVQRLLSCNHVRFRGLMTIGPLVTDPEQSRSLFRELAEVGKACNADWLSMGMSADYDVAIQEGATHVRVGSALFGERT